MNQEIAQVRIGPQFNSPFGQSKGIADFVSIILHNSVAIAGTLLLFLLIFGGISIMIGAGSGKKDDIARGQKAVTYAVVGFLIVFMAYWIIQIIQVLFGNINILNPSAY